MEIWLIALICIGALAVILFLLALLCYASAFFKRCDKNPLLKYFDAEDFGLTCESVELNRGKINLRGFVYRNQRVDDNGKVIIFAHGMGPGQAAYTTEIAYFCGLGYRILALDSRGCGLSGGKSIRGMYEGVKTVEAAFGYLQNNGFGGDIYLLGHSWGAYSVLCASVSADKIIAISAPATPVKAIISGAARIIGPLAYILSPFWYLIGFFLFGKNGNKSAVRCAKKSKCPKLLVHGDCDSVVILKKSAYNGKYVSGVEKLLAKGKAHNPYNTVSAEKKLSELSLKLARCGKTDRSEKEKFFAEFDYAAATEEDCGIMRKMAEFFES